MIETIGKARPLVLVGAGKMGGAMLTGWLDRGLAAEAVVVIEPTPSAELMALLAERGVAHAGAVPAGLKAGVLVLAVKPQVADAVMDGLRSLVDAETLVVSVMAGKTIAGMRAHLGNGAIVRTIPNTPASVGRGITGVAAGEDVGPRARQLATSLIASVGRVVWVDSEADIDVVTAVSGSGPAYVFHMVEALAEAGRRAGLSADSAMQLARATVEGAGELLYQSPLDPATLRQNVTSPNGTTHAALQILMNETSGLTPLMSAAVAAAAKRSRELAG